MKMNGLFESKSILLDVEPSGVESLFQTVVGAMDDTYGFSNVGNEDIVQALLEREKEGTTGIGGGVAIPHAKVEGLNQIAGGFARTSRGIDFRAVDGEAVNLFFFIVSSKEEADQQLEALRKITSAIRRQSNLCSFLRQAETKKDVTEVFKETDQSFT